MPTVVALPPQVSDSHLAIQLEVRCRRFPRLVPFYEPAPGCILHSQRSQRSQRSQFKYSILENTLMPATTSVEIFHNKCCSGKHPPQPHMELILTCAPLEALYYYKLISLKMHMSAERVKFRS